MTSKPATFPVRLGAAAVLLALSSLLVLAPGALATPPSPTTEAASTVHRTDAILRGHLDPGDEAGGVVNCHFEWGTDTSYSGGSVPCEEDTPISSPADVSAKLGFLTESTTYHFRLDVATGGSGIVHGADRTFLTPAFPTVRQELGVIGRDGTAGTAFDGDRFEKLAFRQSTRQLFALNANASTAGGIYGFNASAPMSYPPLSGYPLATGPVRNSQDFAVDSSGVASDGNLYYVSPEGEDEQQRITVSATAGTFRLCLDPDEGGPEPVQCTTDIAYNAEPGFQSGGPGTVSYAIRNLPALVGGTGISAIGNVQNFSVQFGGLFSNENVAQLTCVNGSVPLSGGGGCSVTTTQQGKPSKVQGLSPSGTPLAGGFPIDPTAPFSLPNASGQLGGGLAVDSAGHLWIGNKSASRVLEYDSSGTYMAAVDVSGQVPYLPQFNSGGPAAIAFDGEDNLYVGGYSAGTWRYSAASGYTAATKLTGAFTRAIAIDPSAHRIFIEDEHNAVEEFDPSGDLLGTLPVGGGIAADAVNHYLYIGQSLFSNGWASKIHVFGPDIPQELPTVTSGPASEVLGNSARLNAKVDPETHQVTDCHFEYGTTTAYGETIPCLPAPGSGSGDVAVSAALALEAGATYHFRVVVANATGTVKGKDESFTTLGPLVATSPPTAIGDGTATLHGTVDPAGATATCRFEYGLTEAYGQEAPCTPAEQPATDEVQSLEVASTAGTFALEFGGQKTAELSFEASAAVVQSALRALPKIGPEGVSVSGGPGDAAGSFPYEITFEGPLGGRDVEVLKASTKGFSGTQNRAVVSVAETPKLAVSAQPQGLDPATTYHYRIAAINVDATSYGADATFNTYAAASSFESCANDAYRLGHPSAMLPDCRAYEQATPTEKDGNDAAGVDDRVQAALAGGGITSMNKNGLPGAEGAEQYPVFVSLRGAAAWSTQGLFPPPSYGRDGRVLAWTPDLAYSLLEAMKVVEGRRTKALLLRSSADHSIRLIAPYAQEGNGAGGEVEYGLAGASADDSKIFFEAKGPNLSLVPGDAPGKNNLYLYEQQTERISLIGALPDDQGGEAPAMGASGSSAARFQSGTYENSREALTEKQRPISTGGDRAYFTDDGTGQIYLREGLDSESPETLPVSAAQRSAPDPNGTKRATFETATPSGSIAFFTSCEKLTDDSTAHSDSKEACWGQGSDLYAYDASAHALSDLSVDTEDPGGAEVQGVLGTSDDGSYVYFAANGDLDGESGPAETGDCHSGSGWSGHGCSIYLWHAGSIEFVARLDISGNLEDAKNLVFGLATSVGYGPVSTVVENTARVSADGKTLVFRSDARQTAYDNDAVGGECPGLHSPGCPELYRFNTDTGLACVSCNPTGTAPTGPASLSSLTVSPPNNYVWHPLLTRFVSSDGRRVFFESADKLAVTDTNGDHGCPTQHIANSSIPACQDVYEWEALGAGACTGEASAYAPQDRGCLYLLSPGTGGEPSFFADASASGNDAFIFTNAQLVPADEDGLRDLYDARVEGGLASQYAVLPPPCEGEACRGAGSKAPASQGAGSSSFSGPGDQPQPHLRDCNPATERAQKLAHLAKGLRRHANHASDAARADALRRRAAALAKKAHDVSGDARRCRQANRRAAR